MPIYEYRCLDCGQIFEEWQRSFKVKQLPCPVCKGKTERLISNTSFVLKGGGWYVTDYCKREPGKGSGATAPPSAAKPADDAPAAAEAAPVSAATEAAPEKAKPAATPAKAASDSVTAH